ncbi:T9SS type A sorting domain-containing protein [Brumimicrobium glaciale]|uniref:T9SS type A sorting domain-containing protein n=1 Tax=Brumimicrobium glaciale TaxID=200475 RepID=A0A4Q4KJR7_9FLAO|nr:T9SS type A sorting domain-containing protein [Brumimicrobium glaciale]RYM33583.1 T9SS type A sorting domain-containing protein [Brumimicrobium glaciale]
MKLLYILSYLIFPFFIFGQFTRNNIPQMGDKGFLFHINTPVDKLENINGQNVTWDYSNLYLAASTPCEIEVMLPEDASYSPYMYDPAFVENTDKYAISIKYTYGGARMTFYNYPQGNAEYCQGFAYQGAFSPNTLGDLVTEFAIQPEKVFEFPFNYGDAIYQPIKGNTGFDWGLEHVASQGKSSSKADGKGTLKLGQNIEFNNVLRHQLIDTINISNNEYNVIYREIYSYYNFTKSKFPLFIYSSVKFGKNNGIWNEVIAVFTSEHKTANVDKNNLETIKIYPNPVKNYLNLEIPFLKVSANIDILDNLGKSVLKSKISNQNSKLDLSKLNSGIYFMKIEINGLDKMMKIIKR